MSISQNKFGLLPLNHQLIIHSSVTSVTNNLAAWSVSIYTTYVGMRTEQLLACKPADTRTRAHNDFKFKYTSARTNGFKFSFLARTLTEGNEID